MAKINPLVWTSIGNDWVRDGLTGRLGSPQLFGETMISGATNCVAINEAENGITTFYAGSVNGGVYARNYDRTTGRWEEQWSWVSKPGSGYTGAQSIGALAISEDGIGGYSTKRETVLGNTGGYLLTAGFLNWIGGAFGRAVNRRPVPMKAMYHYYFGPLPKKIPRVSRAERKQIIKLFKSF